MRMEPPGDIMGHEGLVRGEGSDRWGEQTRRRAAMRRQDGGRRHRHVRGGAAARQRKPTAGRWGGGGRAETLPHGPLRIWMHARVRSSESMPRAAAPPIYAGRRAAASPPRVATRATRAQ